MDTEKAQKQTAMSSVEFCWDLLKVVGSHCVVKLCQRIPVLGSGGSHMFAHVPSSSRIGCLGQKIMWSSMKFHIAQEPSTRLFREAFALGREIRVDETSHYRPLQYAFCVVPPVVVSTILRLWSVPKGFRKFWTLGCSWLFMAVQLTLLW